MHSWRPVIRQRWRQLLSNSTRFTGTFQNHDRTPPPHCSQGTNLLTSGGKHGLFLHTHTHICSRSSAVGEWRDKKKKAQKRKEKQFGVGCLVLTRAGSSFWLPELGCHAEWGPKLAVVNWPQLICSLNTAFHLFTPVFEMVLDVFSGFFPR